MNDTLLRKKLWDKVLKEFENFKEKQLSENKEDIFKNAFEISKISDFTDMCDPEMEIFKIEEVKALLKEKYPVHALFYEYMKGDGGESYGDLYDSVWYKLNSLVDENKKQNNKNNKEIER